MFSACGAHSAHSAHSQSQHVSADAIAATAATAANAATTATTVWVSGYVNDGVSSKGCVWKNGLINLLPPEINVSENSFANSIWVENGDVYIGGVIARPNASDADKWQACYWKNGVLTTLDWPGGEGSLYVSGIFVSSRPKPEQL